uniref:sacsin N-terminal ATP-binding-like domain-containing protein n=1 Tax=uncultured Thiodictyon sp. TaxID=1846217 RepID=UPI0025EA3235
MLEDFIKDWRRDWLENYRRTPLMAREHVGIEENVLAGGYGYRQILELVQNGADAVLEEAEAKGCHGRARIHVLFDGQRLYVANTGAPLSREGIESLLMSNLSPKRGNQIGRFGIGFKSLLRLGGIIDILSRGASLRFDPPRCQQEVRNACKRLADSPAPSLRLAWTLDRQAEAQQDQQLHAFDWATTVVRAEVKNPTMGEHLTKEIEAFPARFLLFITTAVDLTLEAPDLEPRRINQTPDSNAVILHDGEASSRWRLIKRVIQVTDPAAVENATHIHRRDEIPLTWAIPLDAKREEPGSFWVAFPTQSLTSIPGILNAPWKVNTDRQSIIDGEWNRALMRKAAAMIAEALPTLANADDPARALDYLPRQDHNALAATLVDELWEQVGTAEIVPDATGTLRLAAELRRHPSDDKTLVARWCEIADETCRADWVHPDCLQGVRAARLRGLAERLAKSPIVGKPALARATAAGWFAKIAAGGEEQAKAVILLTSDYANNLKRGEWPSVRQTLKVVPDRNGALRCPDDIWIASAEQSAQDRHFVADALVRDEVIRRILRKTLGVRSLLNDNWLPILEQTIKDLIEQERTYGSDSRDWNGFWQTLRNARPQDQAAFAAKYKGQVRVRRQDGTWQYPYALLLPGEIVPATDPENRKMLVDADMHCEDEALLRLLGVVSKPEGKQRVYRQVSDAPHFWPMEKNFDDWTAIASRAFRCHHSRVEPQSFLPDSIGLPAGSYLLPHLQGRARTRLTDLLLTGATEEDRVLTLSHHKKPDDYNPVNVEHPLRWLLRIYGSVAIGNVTIPFTTILARCDVSTLRRLTHLAPRLPIIQALAGSPRPQPAGTKALDTFWQALTDHLATREAIVGDTLADLWHNAAADGWVPKRLPGPAGNLEVSEVYVTGSADLARRARALGWTVVELDEETRALWRQKGALDLDAQFSRGWDAAVASFNSLADALPEVAAVLSREGKGQSYTQVVHGLHLRIGEAREPVPCLHWEGVLYLDQAQLEALPHRERLGLILTEAAAAGWLDRTPADALAYIADVTLEDRRHAVAAGADLTERLLRAVGGNVTALHAALGDAACRALPAYGPPTQVAALTLDLLGPAVLQDSHVSEAMKDADLRPPSRWGTDEARAFVAALGFPEAFAQSQSRRLDAELWVSGPLPLPPLHPEYQVEVFEALTGLIAMGSGRRRAVVSLPTGGGKTRIAVEAAVELILKPE